MSDLVIGPAGVGDLDTLVPLFEAYRDFYECELDEPGARRFLGERLANGESTVFLAWAGEGDDRRAVGFAQLYPTWGSLELGPAWVLYDLFVDPDARRGGVGRALLDHAVEFCRGQGAKFVLLETAKDNIRAKGLYESAGWKVDDEFDTYLYEF